jgi:hypothetical protein
MNDHTTHILIGFSVQPTLFIAVIPYKDQCKQQKKLSVHNTPLFSKRKGQSAPFIS